MLRIIFLFLFQSVLGTPFNREEVQYVGRFDMTQYYPSSDWSGSGITLFVDTSSSSNGGNDMVNLTLTANIGAVSVSHSSDEMEYFVGILVNCELLDKREVSATNNVIQISFPASPGALDEIHIIKLTESSYSNAQGEFSLVAYDLSEHSRLVPQDPALNQPKSCRTPTTLNMLIIGDSITAAYGVEGVPPCTYSASTENFMYSYAYLTAQALGADLTTLAWSGKGVVRNYGDPNPTSVDPLPVFYNRTLAPLSAEEVPANYWDPSQYSPGVVLVMLGSNDYSTSPNPSDEDFTSGLVDFLSLIRRDYPMALLGAMCAPMNHGNQCPNIEKAAQLTGASYVSMDSSLYVSEGCDGHPSIQTQQNIADVVTPAVRDMLSGKLLPAE